MKTITVILDTSAYSHFQRGDRRGTELIDGAEWIGLPAIALGELRAGFLLGGRQEQNETMLREFVTTSVVDVLDVDDEVSLHYADIVLELRRAGRPIPTNDIWVAVTAARAGAVVLSADEHFTAIARVGSIMLSPR